MSKKPLSMLAIAFVASCTAVGPDYAPPQTPLETSFVGGGQQLGDVSRDKWWKRLNDRQLDRLVERGLAQSIDIATALLKHHDAPDYTGFTMPWLQIKIPTSPEHTDALEDALLLAGCQAVTLVDTEDQPVFEPIRGTTPLWQHTTIQGLFDHELFVEWGDKRYGPYRPKGGPIPLHRYRKRKPSPRERRVNAVAKLAEQISLPRTALGGAAEEIVAADVVPLPKVKFSDPDPWGQIAYENELSARRAISYLLDRPLA